MFWATYRQFRTTLFGALAVITLVAVVTFLAAWTLRNVSYASSFGTFDLCFGSQSSACITQTALTATTLLTVALPVLIGLFVGVAVFARDIERGTHVLSLSQSVGRLRWYFSRVLVVFVPVILAMLVLGIVFTASRSLSNAWWQTLSGYGDSRFAFPIFETSALMPATYTVLALIIGSLFALWVRHTIAAMVLTLVTVVGLLVLVSVGIRPHYAAPLVQVSPLYDVAGTGEYIGGSARWIVDANYVDAAGNKLTIDYSLCDGGTYWNEAEQRPDETYAEWQVRSDAINQREITRYSECIAAQGADRFETEYHENNQFWRFQWTEAALLLSVSALALGASTLVVRRLRP
ncbi:hypothetical protein [Rhodococcoides kyotonense]|uniref:ABC-2 family transporter protein n=1 Tax=Rhodococcoides kyotonense TaxID=398843 RepID=A0A239N5C3_9NOCA|nr:hypothetical protein [Rhodococcus kyotonensis]SNT50141.1 hypothetical protein SAMN05421642_1305 [Rhodococcus kyotonensis]